MLRLFRKSAPVERKSASLYFGAGAASFSAHRYGAFAYEGYALNPIANACVNRIATAMASVDLHVYTRDKAGKVEKVEKHDLIDLLAKPNPGQSGKKFIRDMASQYLIGGNDYILGTGIDATQRKPQPPKELYLLSPSAVTVVKGTGILPKAYEYKQESGTTTFPVNPLTGISSVLHIKTFNPLNPWYGMAPMIAASYGIDIFNSGQKWNKALLDNSGRPSGALVVKNSDGTSGTLAEEQYLRLQAQINEQISGPQNSGKPLLLEGGLDWTEMSINPKDMDHRENMLTNARFIAGIYNVPPQLVNIPGESTYSNMREAMQFFWTDTVIPLLCSFLDELNEWLAARYGDGVYIWYDEDMIPALESKRKEKADRINAAEYMTIDEKRTAMGLPALPDDIGNVVLVSSTQVPLDLAGAVELSEPEDDQKPDEEDEEEE